MKDNVSTVKAVTISTLIAVSSFLSGCILAVPYGIKTYNDYGQSRAELNDSIIPEIMEKLYQNSKKVHTDTLDGANTLTCTNGNGLHVFLYDQKPHKQLSVGDFACVTVDSDSGLVKTPIQICDLVEDSNEDSFLPSFLRISIKHIGENPKDLDPKELHKQRQYIKKILPKYFPNLRF